MLMLREVAPGEAAGECPNCHATLAPPGAADRPWIIRQPRDVYDRLSLGLAQRDREELHVLLLTTKNRVLQDVTVYVGNVSASLVRVGEVFTEAIRHGAVAGIILVHNHPSGDPTPSPDDLHLTAEVLAAGRLLNIDLLDHVIVARDGFVSLRDRGVVFDRPPRS